MRPDPDELGQDAHEFDRLVGLLSTITDDDAARDELPADLWDRIAERLPTADQPSLVATSAEVRVLGHGDDAADSRAGHPSGPTDLSGPTDPSGQAEPATSGSAEVVDLGQRRRQRWLRVAAVAAALVLAVGTYGLIAANGSGSTQELVASVDLQPLKDAGSGSAELVVVDGVEKLRINAEGLPPATPGHHYEMWLIDAAVTDPQSLGPLPEGRDEVVVDVPAGIDPDEFPIVDINLQVDGEAQHSGVDTSVLRGTLA